MREFVAILLLLGAGAARAQTTFGMNVPGQGQCPIVNVTNICLTLPPYNADRTGAIDASKALNAAIAALPATGGTIWVPNGIYTLNGALQQTTGANAVIPMPMLPNNQNALSVVTIRGVDSINGANANSGSVAGSSGSVFSTSLASGNLIGGYDSVRGGGSPPATNVHLQMYNLTIVDTNSSTNAVMVNATNLEAFQGENLLIKTAASQLNGKGAGAASAAILMPAILNNVRNHLNDITVAGFGIGYKLTEHTQVDSIYAVNNINCFVFDNGANSTAPASYKGNSVAVDYLWEQNCANAIVGGLNPTTINVQNADLELPGTYGISDPNNMLHGVVNVLNPYTPFTNTPIHGATNLRVNYLYNYQSGGATNSTENAVVPATTTATTYAVAATQYTANGSDSFSWELYNSYNDTARKGVFALIDNTQGASKGPATAGIPIAYTPAGDLCFLIPTVSTTNETANLNNCAGALFRLNHDGSTSGISKTEGSTGSYGAPTFSPAVAASTRINPTLGAGDDHSFSVSFNPSANVPPGTILGTVTFGKGWYRAFGVQVIPNCMVSITGGYYPVYLTAITKTTATIATAPGTTLPSGTYWDLLFQCSADHEE